MPPPPLQKSQFPVLAAIKSRRVSVFVNKVHTLWCTVRKINRWRYYCLSVCDINVHPFPSFWLDYTSHMASSVIYRETCQNFSNSAPCSNWEPSFPLIFDSFSLYWGTDCSPYGNILSYNTFDRFHDVNLCLVVFLTFLALKTYFQINLLNYSNTPF